MLIYLEAMGYRLEETGFDCSRGTCQTVSLAPAHWSLTGLKWTSLARPLSPMMEMAWSMPPDSVPTYFSHLAVNSAMRCTTATPCQPCVSDDAEHCHMAGILAHPLPAIRRALSPLASIHNHRSCLPKGLHPDSGCSCCQWCLWAGQLPSRKALCQCMAGWQRWETLPLGGAVSGRLQGKPEQQHRPGQMSWRGQSLQQGRKGSETGGALKCVRSPT